MARRVLEYMDELVTVLDDPRRRGKALTGPMGGLWRYRIGRCRLSATFKIRCCVFWCYGSQAGTRA